VQSLVSTVPMVLMYLAMLGDVVLSIFANLRILKAQLMALRSFGIDPCTTPAHRKYIMFLRLAKFTALYVLLELTIHTAFTGRSEEWFWLFVLLHQLMELFIAVGSAPPRGPRTPPQAAGLAPLGARASAAPESPLTARAARRRSRLHLPRAALQRALPAGTAAGHRARADLGLTPPPPRISPTRCSKWRPSSPTSCCPRSRPSRSSRTCSTAPISSRGAPTSSSAPTGTRTCP
jgi:hypothetical protein